jgi:twitching motility two-component system response regulator PilG
MAQSDPATSRQLRVLIVEDDREIREMVALMVKGMGYAIMMAATGKEALARLREQMADIVLLDLMMPEMDGFEFCRTVQGDQNLRDLHIIITSARDTLEDKVKRQTTSPSRSA